MERDGDGDERYAVHHTTAVSSVYMLLPLQSLAVQYLVWSKAEQSNPSHPGCLLFKSNGWMGDRGRFIHAGHQY